MKKLLLAILFFLATFSANAQSNIVWYNTNPTMDYEPGEEMYYDIVITNTGPMPAQVHVYNPIPAGIPIVNGFVKFAWTATNGFSGNNQQLDNTITIGVNQTIVYTVRIRIPGDYTAALPHPQVTYKPKADIVVVNTDNKSYYTAGGTSTYTVTVTNNGPEVADVRVQYAMPAGVTNYSWVGSNGTGQTNLPLSDQILNMAVGQTVTYTVTVTVPAGHTGNFETTAQIYGPNDPVPTCPQCTDTDVPATGADIVVTTTNGQLVYTAGGTATYTVTVNNAGPNDASAVHVTSAIPAGVTIYSWTGSNGTSGAGALDDTIATLPNGQTVTYTITLQVPAAQTAPLTVTAQAASTTPDPAPACAACTDTDYAATSADLVITQTLNSGATFAPGAPAIYTITVVNNGPTAAQDVNVTSILPAGITAAQVSWSGSNGTSGTGALNAVIPLLPNGETITYTLIIDVPSNYPATQNLENQINVTSTTPDPDTACATCLLVATPEPQANIVTYKTNGQTSYLAGEQVTYTITVTNAGPSDATNVKVSDPAPYYTSSMTWSGNGSGGAGSLNNTIPVLAAGQTVQYRVNLFVPADFPDFIGNLINTVTVTSPDVPDPVPACPYCSDTDTPRGKFVSASNNIYTVEELVKDVLIDAECVGISNITSSTGTNFGQPNGIAFFHRENSNFPIKSGVALVCGNAVGTGPYNQGVQGPNIKSTPAGVTPPYPTFLTNSPGWPGDPQLDTFAGATTNDASWIKFNFKPLTNTFKFNYLFASEEYTAGSQNFECTWSDVFAFILTDLTTGVTQNIALIPGTSTPVTVTNIRPAVPGSCGAANPQYFGQYNNTAAAAAISPINFNGQSVVMTAQGNVDPTHEYSIKLAVANRGDHAWNAAVFLEAGSFDIGQPQLPGDLTMETGMAVCYEQAYTLTVNTQGMSYLLKWKRNGELILDDDGNPVTTASIQVTEPGTYTVLASSAQDPTCSLTDDVVIEFLPQIAAGNANDLIQCENATGVYTFDLTQNIAPVANGLNPGDYPLSIHTSENDATYGFSALTTAQAQNFQGTNGQIIYMRVEDLAYGCYVIRPFKLIITPLPVANEAQDIELCDTGNDNTEQFDLTSRTAQILGSQTPAHYTVTYHTTQAAANNNDVDITTPAAYSAADNTTVYARITSNGNTNCFAVTSFDLILNPAPVITAPADGFACQAAGYTLPALAEGNYFTQPGGAGTQLNAGDVITTSQTIHIYAETGTTPNCTAEASFNVTIYPQPVIPALAEIAECDATGAAGEETFDLTPRTADILAALPGALVSYYPTQAAAQAGTGAIADASAYQSGTGPVWVRVEDANGCVSTASFSLVVKPLPAINTNPAPLAECETAPGESMFMLTEANSNITNGNTTYQVRYYASQAEADAGGAGLDADYTSTNGFVVARVDDPVTGCYTTVQLQLIVVATPTLGAVTPIAECNDDYDGDAIFDLTAAGDQAVNGQPGLVVTYHTSQADAEAPTAQNPIADPSAYESPTAQVFIRVTDATGAGCYSTTSVQLTVLPKPAVNTVPVYALCDDGDANIGYTTFDLTSRAAALTGNNPAVTVTYYATQADIAANNPIATPAAYTNTAEGQQTIYVVLENTQGCTSQGQFTIKVNPLPVIDTALGTFYACEETPGQGQFMLSRNDAAVTMGAAGYNVIYYQTLAQAQAGGSTGVIGDGFISGPTTIGVRVEDALTGCASTTTLNLDVIPGPVAADPAPLQECDLNNDGVAAFNLNPVLTQLGATIPNVTLTVHETPQDAEYDANAIAAGQLGAYTNVNANGTAVPTVYIRVQSTLTDCFDVVALQLIANPVPVAIEPEPYHVCDDNTDGMAIFDLSSRNAEILGTQSPADYVVTYHTSQAAADAGTGAITNVTNYNSASTTLYVRVTNNVASNPTGCYDIVQLELVVDPLPVANTPAPYTLCDDNNPGDEREVFDLTTKIAEITGSATGVDVTFHLTMAAAQGNTGAIANPAAYTNTSTVQTLFVRVTNAETGCYRVVLMDIRVEPLPQITMPPAEDLQACGANGYAQFDLQALEQALINNGVGLAIRFYETLTDAQEGNGNYIPNTTSYTNNVPYAQTLYIRVENTITGCVNTQATAITLTVGAPPVLEELDNIVLCDEDNNDQDGRTIVNLTQQDAAITAMTGPGYTIQYFTQESYAEAGAPRITNPATYVGTDGEIIWARATGPDGCYAIASFELEIGKPLQLTTPTPLTACSAVIPSTGSATFDLTLKDDEILGPFGVGQGYTVEYFVSQAAMNANTPIANPQAYVKPAGGPQTLLVRVTGPEGCRSYATLTIRVLPKPNPDTTPDTLEMCEDLAIGAGQAEFNLTDAEADIRNNDTTVVLTYYTTMADAEVAANAIANPAAYISTSATIYVRVQANTGNANDPGCYTVVELPIVVNPVPVLGDPANANFIKPYAQCQIPYVGTAYFTLNSHAAEILIGQDASQYNLRFFESQTAAEAGTPALPNYYQSTVPVKQVWVRADNIATECYSIGTFELLIDLGAVANTPSPANIPDTCDNDGTNDGITTIDLTVMTNDILGTTQSEPQFTVTYYEEDPRVNPAAVAIATPNAYVNTNSPDLVTIWAEVTNTSTLAPCRDYVSVDILIERLPVPDIQGGTICVEYPSGAIVRPLPLNSGLDASHTFVWYKDGVVIQGATGPSYLAEEAGAYSVIATSATGCVSDAQVPVQVVRSSQAVAVGTGYTVSNAFSDDQTITINVEGFGTYEYRLDNGPWQDSNIFTGVTPGSHKVTVRDTTQGACENLVLLDVSIIDYPNFFTPNGDGYNDRWNIIGLGSRNNNQNAKIYIFDRYGKLMKQIASEGQGWDGTYMGNPVPADDYWFTVEYQELIDGIYVTKEFKANFSLKR